MSAETERAARAAGWRACALRAAELIQKQANGYRAEVGGWKENPREQERLNVAANVLESAAGRLARLADEEGLHPAAVAGRLGPGEER
jgi:hypothetical protein